MKKLLCAAAAVSLILAGCGDESYIIDDGGEYVVAERVPVETLPKIKPVAEETTVTAEEKSEEGVKKDSDKKLDEKIKKDETEKPKSDKVSDNTEENDTSVSEEDDDNSSSEESSPEEHIIISEAEDTETKQEEEPEAPVEKYYLEGIVYQVKNDGIVVKDPDIGFVDTRFEDKNAFSDIDIGDVVLITHSGDVTLDDLSVAPEAYDITVTSEAECDYQLQRFGYEEDGIALEFSMLVPSDWLNKQIGYPLGEDFTDWGIRFTPPDGKNGIDISWHSSFSVREAYDIRPLTVYGKSVKRYSRDNKWHYYTFGDNYVAANNFYGKEGYNEYSDRLEFMVESLEFSTLDFIS